MLDASRCQGQSRTPADMIERRANWVVLMRVQEGSWCAYGPMTHREALDFRRGTTGVGERVVAQLIPGPRKQYSAAPHAEGDK